MGGQHNTAVLEVSELVVRRGLSTRSALCCRLLDSTEALRDLYSGLHASLGDLSHGQIGEVQEELQVWPRALSKLCN